MPGRGRKHEKVGADRIHCAPHLREGKTQFFTPLPHGLNRLLPEHVVIKSRDRGFLGENVDGERQAGPPVITGKEFGKNADTDAQAGQAIAFGKRADESHVGGNVLLPKERPVCLCLALFRGKMDVCLVNDKEAVPGEFLRQPADFPRPRTVAGGIVRRRHENETRVFVDMGVQLVKVEDEIGRQRLASDLNAVDETLNRIEREARLETDDIVPAGCGHDADDHVNDLIGSVAHGNARFRQAEIAGDGLHKTGISSRRIAERLPCVTGEDFLHQRRCSKRVFVAGHLDDFLYSVFLPDLLNGTPRHIGFERPDLGPDKIFEHKTSRRFFQKKEPPPRGGGSHNDKGQLPELLAFRSRNGVRPDGQDRHRGPLHNLFCHGSKKNAINALASVRSHNNEIAVFFRGRLQDFLGGIANDDAAFGFNALEILFDKVGHSLLGTGHNLSDKVLNGRRRDMEAHVLAQRRSRVDGEHAGMARFGEERGVFGHLSAILGKIDSTENLLDFLH